MIRPIFATVLALAFAFSLAEDDVVVATKDNFDELIGSDQLTLVKFFAPWCGHCKKMAPDFKEAATELKGKAILVDLDATVEKDIATKYNIRGFPTLKLFSKGELLSDYKGGRTKDDIIKYIERALLPSFEELADADAVAKFVKDNAGKARVFGAALDALKSDFQKASLSLRDVMADSIAFATVEDASLIKEIAGGDVAADSVVLAREDDTVDTYSKGDGIEEWLKISALPLFAELSRDNAMLYTELDKPILMLFQDPDKKDESINNDMKEIASTFRGQMPFTWINIVELKSFAEHLGVADNSPAIGVYEFKTDTKFTFTDTYTKDALSAWVGKVAKGEVAATMKSAPIPETNDEPVKVVVGDSWADIVEDETKDVLIEQYAPWCGHCKKLAPILDDLATKLKGVDSIVIAKMDATANDAPTGYKAQGYPTLHFFKAGSSKGVPYEGGRELKDFIKFFKENATNKDDIDISEDAEEAKDAEEADKDSEDKEEL